VQEWVTHSWYKYPQEQNGLHPFDGVTEPNFDIGKAKGTRTNIENVDESAKYSWVKSPRWKGNPVEVGPLARYIVGYARGHKEMTEQINLVLKTLDVPVTALFSTLGRTAARGLEAQWAAHKMRYFYDQLIANIKAGDLNTANVEKWEPSTWPAEAKGVAPVEAPRGALAHWVKIKDTKIENYQCVVPTTWNAGPRDAKGQIGAYEASLMNTPMVNPEQPLEILRTIHSFDPCLACATHVMSPDGQELAQVTVR
jgi:hydrogenase large subunit